MFVYIHDIYELYAAAGDLRTTSLHSIEPEKSSYEVTRSITLLPMTIGPEDVMAFRYPDSEPNYITS